MIEISDEVVDQARGGDVEAFRKILKVFERPIYQTVYRMVGGRFPNEVEDITQDIFLKIFRAISQFDPLRGVKFSTWVYAFVKNHCFDVLKRRRLPVISYDTTRSDDDDRSKIELASTEPSPTHAAEADELGDRIAAAVDELPIDQRMVFILREYQGLDYREIGQVVGCSEGTVKSRLYRAKEALRRSLRKYVLQG